MLVIATSYFIWKAYNMSGVCSVTVKQTNKQTGPSQGSKCLDL